MSYKFNPFTKKPDYYETSSGGGSIDLVNNLKPVINANVNKLDIFTKSGGAAPDATDFFTIAIPDGNGYTARTRKEQYASGNSQIVMADAANYWSKGSLDAEIKTAWLYAIWDGTGIVWALAGYSGFTMVPTTTTATDDDYFLLEDGSSYTRSNSHYCVAVAKIRYQYDTADTPDHTIQATVENAPQVIWNPKSDYSRTSYLATTNTSAGDIAFYSAVSIVVKQSGKYMILGQMVGLGLTKQINIKTGSATYGSAVKKGYAMQYAGTQTRETPATLTACYLNSGDTVHLGCSVNESSGNRIIYGEDNSDYGVRATGIVATKID